jgi:hypothetical protein
MLYGGVAWSELPISTQGQVVPNGDELEFDGLIKLLLESELEVKTLDDFDLVVNMQPLFEVEINTLQAEELEYNPLLDFELEIDRDNEWSL